MTAKKCTKERDARAKLFCQSKLITFLPFSLPLPSSLLPNTNTVDINCTDIDRIRDDTEEAPGNGRRRGGSAVLLGLEKMAEKFTRYITNTLWSLALLHKFDTELSEIFPGWGQVVSNKRNSFLNVIGNGGYVGTFVSHSFDALPVHLKGK